MESSLDYYSSLCSSYLAWTCDIYHSLHILVPFHGFLQLLIRHREQIYFFFLFFGLLSVRSFVLLRINPTCKRCSKRIAFVFHSSLSFSAEASFSWLSSNFASNNSKEHLWHSFRRESSRNCSLIGISIISEWRQPDLPDCRSAILVINAVISTED